MKKQLIYCIFYLWMIRPTRENTPPEAFDVFEAGITDEQAGRKAEAMEKYEKAIEIYPEFEAAWINLAMVHQDMGNIILSTSTAKRALEHLPSSTAIWGTLGTFYSQIQLMEAKAEEAFRKAVECNPKNSLAMANLGILLAKLGRNEEAEEILEKSRVVNPGGIGETEEWDAYVRKHLAAVKSKLQIEGSSSSKEDMMSEKYMKEVFPLLKLADMHIQKGELSKAEGLFKKAIDFNLNAAEIWFRLGTLYYQMGRRSDEKDALRCAIEINGNHVGARIDLASSLIEEGEYGKAEGLLRSVIPDAPSNHFAWMNLGKSLIAQGHDQEGEQALKKVIELYPEYVNAHFQLGKVYLRRHDLEQAETAFRNTIKYKQEHAGAWLELGIVLANSDRPEEAEKAWRTATEYDPNDDAPWVNLAGHLTVRGRCDEAKQALTRAQQLAPNDEYVIKAEMLWKTYCGGGATTDVSVITKETEQENESYVEMINTGAVMFDNEKFLEAEHYYRKAIELDKSNPIGWGMLGTVLRAQEKLEAAYSAFKEALSLSTASHPTILLNYSILLKQIGKENEAEGVLKQLTKHHKELAIGWFNLGNLYLKWGDLKKASTMYKESLKKNPDRKLLPKIKWNLGVAFKEMKKYKESERSLLEALELDPSNADIRKVLAEVRTLQRGK